MTILVLMFPTMRIRFNIDTDTQAWASLGMLAVFATTSAVILEIRERLSSPS
jgi:hypothetical protein